MHILEAIKTGRPIKRPHHNHYFSQKEISKELIAYIKCQLTWTVFDVDFMATDWAVQPAEHFNEFK